MSEKYTSWSALYINTVQCSYVHATKFISIMEKSVESPETNTPQESHPCTATGIETST